MKVALLFSILSISAANAAATIIDFSDLRVSGTEAGSFQTPYAKEGFVLNVDGGTLLFWDTENPFFLGQPAVFPADIGEAITLTRADGGAFSLVSIDLAPFAPLIPVPYLVNFLGTRQDGTQISQQISVSSSDSFTHGLFDNFNDLTAFAWTQDTSNFSQATNILAIANQNVPEPNSSLLVMVGVLALYFRTRIRGHHPSMCG